MWTYSFIPAHKAATCTTYNENMDEAIELTHNKNFKLDFGRIFYLLSNRNFIEDICAVAFLGLI